MENFLRVAGIVDESIVDGPGIRLTVFVQGCTHNCEGCHNLESHPVDGGTNESIENILSMIDKNPLLDGITISGGEPFQQAVACAELARCVQQKNFTVITYTGYTFEYILEMSNQNEGWKELLENTDILVDGPFVLAKRSLLLRFRGSENQRLIDVKKSLNQLQIERVDL